jgi:hypothetical protein
MAKLLFGHLFFIIFATEFYGHRGHGLQQRRAGCRGNKNRIYIEKHEGFP